MCCTFALTIVYGQPTESVMESNGKIYVVMAVVVTIVLALFGYVYSIDKKLNKLEKE
ncbi:MAG: CcmD family protein [Bacteroidetes bacterium]|jgi:CcmD family protein|nr:MAG: CcmD family protein [Bacteroidota bacterium]TAE69904.1 MAG: CcmD family protein [Bacteroidota bacterium]TAF90629.1 MAG: CcmD family protein [Bacteroidota bacterium]